MQFLTNRLIVREPIPTDAQDIFEGYATDVDVAKYLTWTPHRSLSESEAWIRFCIENFDPDKWLPFILFHREDQKAIGMLDFRIADFHAVFGYVLGKKYWNQGLMTEAMIPVMDHVYSQPQIYRISASHDLENGSSGRVMQKVGMEFEGIYRRYIVLPNLSPVPRDVKIYAKVK